MNRDMYFVNDGNIIFLYRESSNDNEGILCIWINNTIHILVIHFLNTQIGADLRLKRCLYFQGFGDQSCLMVA